MSRLDQLPESRLVKRIADARAALQQLKNAQTFGSSSVKTHRVFSSAPSDITVAAVNLTIRRVLVAFTPADTGQDGLGLVHSMRFTHVVTGYQFPAIWVERQLPTAGQQTWIVYLSGVNSPTCDVSLKFYFYANGDGTFTANEI
jgi:hypothetical protein